MCGVAGIIGRIEPGDLERVTAASDALTHRGPDDEGLWSHTVPDGSFGAILAHRRLAIIDLDHAAAQPMIDAATGTALVFNGEIYNFQDIRDELERLGERFVTSGDSEVILRGYLRWGKAIVPRLRGMFAFVIVDPVAQTALLARDGFGIKPLYMARIRDAHGVRAIAFASEGRALLRAGFARGATDPARIYHYIWSGFSIGPGTIWSDIDEFPRGSHATLSATQIEPRAQRFWQPGRGAAGPQASAADMLEESVRRHLVADVPKVVFLSGGVDSTALVGLARRYESDLETMSLGFAEEAYDEGRFAEQIAARTGTRHHNIRYSASEMLAAIDHSIAALDQPSFDGTNTWLVSRAAAELGFKVGLSGAGGDELTGGYTSFRRLPRLARMLAGPVGALAPAAARLLALVAPGQTARRKLEDVARSNGDLVRLYQTQYGLRSDHDTRALLAADVPAGLSCGLSAARMDELTAEVAALPPVQAVSVLEAELFLGDRLLRDSDAVSMANSLELRVPFVDTCLFDGFDTLPIEERYMPLGSKPPLRAIAYATAGQELVDRPKRGFELPIDRWLRHELRETVAQTLLDRDTCRAIGLDPRQVALTWDNFLKTDRVYWTRIWALFVLLRWSVANATVMA